MGKANPVQYFPVMCINVRAKAHYANSGDVHERDHILVEACVGRNCVPFFALFKYMPRGFDSFFLHRDAIYDEYSHGMTISPQ